MEVKEEEGGPMVIGNLVGFDLLSWTLTVRGAFLWESEGDIGRSFISIVNVDLIHRKRHWLEILLRRKERRKRRWRRREYLKWFCIKFCCSLRFSKLLESDEWEGLDDLKVFLRTVLHIIWILSHMIVFLDEIMEAWHIYQYSCSLLLINIHALYC